MALVGVEEDLAIQAARILLTLRNRRLRRWPEWVEKKSEAAEVEVCLQDRWTKKRQRSGNRLRRAAMFLPMQGLVAGSTYAGPGACSSGVERERSPAPPRWRERSLAGPFRDEGLEPAAARRPDLLAYYVAPAGSGPSTSADRKARPPHAVEMAVTMSPAEVAALPKELVKASSPETPLHFGAAAAGSGASSSCDDATRRRKAPGALGSVGSLSGDEGCSSPDKRARVAAGEGAILEPKMQTPDNNSEKGVKFAFDLNMPCPEDDESPGFC